MRAKRSDLAVAGLWGFAEATVFFIVPDVWLSFVAFRKGLRPALGATLPVLLGALLGGSLIYWLAVDEHAQIAAIIVAVPGISAGLMDEVAARLREHGALAMVAGAFQGIPYKIYAVQAAAAGVGFLGFALISIPARLLRFALVAALAAGIARLLRRWSAATRVRLLAAFWLVFYALYFWLMAAVADDGGLSSPVSFIQSLAASPR